MRLWTRFAALLFFVPLIASAQFANLDAAVSNLERGFGSGDVQAIVSGIGEGEQVQLEFPGLIDQRGFFGRDQASYLLDGLFNKVRPSGFERVNARKVSAEKQYHITAKWTISNGDRDLYVTLREKDGKWSVVSVKSAGQ